MLRFNIQQLQPKAFSAMLALEDYLSTTSIPPALKSLMKIRASQINKCAFCIDMHVKEAVREGETHQRIYLLNAWRETSVFSDGEKAALAITEELTLVHQSGLSNNTYQSALQFFSQAEIAQIVMCVVTINAWNRIVISSKMPVQDEY